MAFCVNCGTNQDTKGRYELNYVIRSTNSHALLSSDLKENSIWLCPHCKTESHTQDSPIYDSVKLRIRAGAFPTHPANVPYLACFKFAYSDARHWTYVLLYADSPEAIEKQKREYVSTYFEDEDGEERSDGFWWPNQDVLITCVSTKRLSERMLGTLQELGIC